MKKLTVKEILEMNEKDLEKIMTEQQFDKMKELGMEHTWQLLDALKDSAKQSGQEENEEHISISEYLDYLEDMKF